MGDAPIHDLEKFRETAQARGSVICIRCKGLVDWYATKCPGCGMNFAGPAFQFCAEIPDAKPLPKHGCLGMALLAAEAVVILYVVTA